ncbi:MAG: hypothetical protein VX589_09990 [Myxococcota bacterium]|nr:hypothetical protein [Myxococcota bacterium]
MAIPGFRRWNSALLMLCSASLLSCSPIRTNDALALEEGERCRSDPECGPGLLCASDGTCSKVGAAGTGRRGDTCTRDIFCADGLVCGPSGTCDLYRPSVAGKRCDDDIPCEEGLVCDQNGRCALPTDPGTTPAGEACERSDDCAYALYCDTTDQCVSFPAWAGVTCAVPRPEATPNVLFTVPRGTANERFFDMPFPNDIYQRFGGLDLNNFPGTAAGDAPSAFLGPYSTLVEQTSSGFSPNSAVFVRFSHPLDYDSLKFGTTNATFTFIDVTEGSSRFGQPPRSRFYATEAATPYMCQNWLAIRASEGTPLTSGHQYAVVFRRGLNDSNDVPFEPSPDFARLLETTAPDDPALLDAWQKYAPIRNWLKTADIATEDIIGGTLFTVGHPQNVASHILEGATATPSTPPSDIVDCRSGLASVCGSQPDRTCRRNHPDFNEYQARLDVPNFLSGIAPYTETGGRIEFIDGKPRVKRIDPVCISLTVPKGEPPEGGWPTAIFASDIGGHFRSHIIDGLAGKLAQLGWAVVGFDHVLHGDRTDSSTPLNASEIAGIFYDFNRPGLMRDLFLQGIADISTVSRFIAGGKLTTADDTISLDSEKRVFVGRGYGSEVGVPYLAYASGELAGVFLDGGASLTDYIRFAQWPTRPLETMITSLGQQKLDDIHPALHLIQHWLDPRDPQVYGRLFRRPTLDIPLKHLFYLYSASSPERTVETRNAFILGLALPSVGQTIETLSGVKPADSPRTAVRANLGQRVTHGIKQYRVNGDTTADLLDNESASADLSTFLDTLISDEDGIPTIPGDE